MPSKMAEPSRATVKVLDLGEGLNFDVSPANLSPGSTISADNWVMREGGITPRPGQLKLGNNPQIGGPITGGYDVITSEGIHFQLVSGTTLMSYLSSGVSWVNLPWGSSFVGARSPNPAVTKWWINQSVRSDGSIVAFMAPTVPDSNASGAPVGCWLPGEANWSTLTGNVPAKAVVSFSNYLLFWSTGTFSGATYIPYPTRVQWTDRGDCLSPVPTALNLAGYEDLLDARGRGTGAAVVENKVILFTEEETWQGLELGVPGFAQFQFSPLDRSVGCRRPFTIQNTPEGVMFVGQDNYVYLIPKTGGPPVLVSKQVAQLLRGNDSSWAVYNVAEHRYELYSTVASIMSAEIGSVSAYSVINFTSSTISWENIHFTGSESLEIWLSTATAGWGLAPVSTVPYTGFTTQSYTVSGLTSGTTYQFGVRAVRNGEYTSGWSTFSPNGWTPSVATYSPRSSIVTTPVPSALQIPNAPVMAGEIECTDFTVGPKNYVTKVIGWTPSDSTLASYTDLYVSAHTTLFDANTATLVTSFTTSVTSYSVTLLLPPNASRDTNTYAVRARTLDYGAGAQVSPFSDKVTLYNRACV